MVTYQFLWTKQPNILLSSCRSEYIFSIGSMKDNWSFECRRRKQKQRSDAPIRQPQSAHFLACLVTMLRGGVTGRLPLGFFFSAGFKICKWNMQRCNWCPNEHLQHSTKVLRRVMTFQLSSQSTNHQMKRKSKGHSRPTFKHRWLNWRVQDECFEKCRFKFLTSASAL